MGNFEKPSQRLAKLEEELRKRGENVTAEKTASNSEAAKAFFERLGKKNRDDLLAGIGADVQEAMRVKAHQLLRNTTYTEQVELIPKAEDLIRTTPPTIMVARLHAIEEHPGEHRHDEQDVVLALAFAMLTD